MFSGRTVPPDNKETEIESSNQKASPSAGKNVGIVLVPFHAWKWKCVPAAICYDKFVSTDEFSVRVKKITSRICVS